MFAVISGAGGAAFVQLQRARAAQAAQFEATHRALIRSDPFLSVVYGLAAAKPLLVSSKSWKAAQLSESLQRAVQANLAVSAPIATGQQAMWSLIKLRNGALISGGADGTLRRWRGGSAPTEGPFILAGQGGVTSLIELASGVLISGGADGTLRSWSPAPIARAACRQIDLPSIPTDTGLGPVVQAAQATCRALGVP
ncbi:MAG: hypothetical protein ACK583_13375 [Cyanobacteriota bacterium]